MAERAGAGPVRTRRRFVRRQWARRWLAWRPLLAALATLLALGVVAWLVLFSAALDVEEVEVTGVELLAAEDVRRAVGGVGGTALARVDVAEAERRVEGLTPVLRAEVSRRWPDGLAVAVTERDAVAVVDLGGSLRGIDANGVVFRRYGRAPAGLPRILVPPGTRREAMAEAAHVVAVLPADLGRRVRRVEVETVDAISLVLRGGRSVVWGSADDSEAKARVLDALLAAVEARVYDVSAPGQPTTRG